MQQIDRIKACIVSKRVVWRNHALVRMMQREIKRAQVKTAVNTGEIIEEYPNDKPCPSFLIAGRATHQMLHILVAYDSRNDTCYIVTVYEPDTEHFETDLKTRKTDRV